MSFIEELQATLDIEVKGYMLNKGYIDYVGPVCMCDPMGFPYEFYRWHLDNVAEKDLEKYIVDVVLGELTDLTLEIDDDVQIIWRSPPKVIRKDGQLELSMRVSVKPFGLIKKVNMTKKEEIVTMKEDKTVEVLARNILSEKERAQQ